MDHLKSLFEKFKNNGGTSEETSELLEVIANHKADRVVMELIEESLDEEYIDAPELAHTVNEVYQNINKQIFEKPDPQFGWGKIKIWKWYSVAATVFFGVVLVSMFIYKVYDHQEHTSEYANDIAPVKSGVTLTLANGKKINLNQAGNGELAKEAGITISKTADGRLIYGSKQNGQNAVSINTLSTGKGEVFQLELPDGSLVWLNALSSITYSAALLEDGARRVKLAGEAYFQVAKDRSHPFIVTSLKQEVEVLGTHFNINSYENEGEVKTTLLEGSVKVKPQFSTPGRNAVLKPGQQSVLTSGNLKITSQDTLDVVGWKNGDFIFKEESLEGIMREVARWYEVQVIYDADYPRNVMLGGLVSRSKNISAVLRLIEATGKVHFKLKGNTVTVTK